MFIDKRFIILQKGGIMKRKKTVGEKSPNLSEQPEISDEQQIEASSDEGEVNASITDQAFTDDIPEPGVKDEGIVAGFDNAADNEEELIAKKEEEDKADLPKKPFRPAIFGLGVLCGLIVAMIIFGVYYYLAGQEVCNGYNSVTNSEKKLTSLITSQKNREATTPSECPTVLSETEKAEISDWKIYQNEQYKISFKVPSGWLQEKPATANQFFFKAPGEVSAYLTVGMDLATISSVKDGYRLTSTTTQKVACQVAKTTTYTDAENNSDQIEKNKLQIVKFSALDIPYQFDYNWQNDVGASMSADYQDIFKLILKTVTLND